MSESDQSQNPDTTEENTEQEQIPIPEESVQADQVSNVESEETESDDVSQVTKSKQEEEPQNPKPKEMATLSQLVLSLPEQEKQKIYDAIVSYVQNKLDRDTLLHTVFAKAEVAIVKQNFR